MEELIQKIKEASLPEQTEYLMILAVQKIAELEARIIELEQKLLL